MLALLTRVAGPHVVVVAFLLGAAVSAVPVSVLSYKLGYGLGYASGAAAADSQAEVNDLSRRLAERERDLQAAQEQSQRAAQQAEENAYSTVEAQRVADEYRRELESLSSAASTPSPDRAVAENAVDPRCRLVHPVDARRLSVDIGQGRSAVRPRSARGG